MKALLLAAGLGTRLRPLTDTIPKCLVPIDGKPLLEYWLDLLDNAGVTQFYINLHYFPDAVRACVNATRHAKNVIFVEESELLGTGGTLKKNAEIFGNEAFFIAHADNLCLTDFRAFINAHNSRPDNCAITMMTFDPPDPKTCGVVKLDEQNRVVEFFEKVENPPTRLANGAVFIMEPEVARFTTAFPKDHFEISRDIIPAYTGRILAWHNDDYHLDIGTPETYKQAQEDVDIIRALITKFTQKA